MTIVVSEDPPSSAGYDNFNQADVRLQQGSNNSCQSINDKKESNDGSGGGNELMVHQLRQLKRMEIMKEIVKTEKTFVEGLLFLDRVSHHYARYFIMSCIYICICINIICCGTIATHAFCSILYSIIYPP